MMNNLLKRGIWPIGTACNYITTITDMCTCKSDAHVCGMQEGNIGGYALPDTWTSVQHSRFRSRLRQLQIWEGIERLSSGSCLVTWRDR